MQLLQKRQVWLNSAAAALLAGVLCQCTTDDTGTACTNPNATNISADTVQGENPVVEVIRLDRDPVCETFNCLTHLGIPSYCTRSCTNNSPPASKVTCSTDSDCKWPLHCNKGVCNDDDCPKGFVCKTIQDVGPLKDQDFCVRRTNCGNDLECENIGTLVCEPLACYDICAETPTAPCALHRYTCNSDKVADCGCVGTSNVCSENSTLQCPPASSGQQPLFTATRHNVCLPK